MQNSFLNKSANFWFYLNVVCLLTLAPALVFSPAVWARSGFNGAFESFNPQVWKADTGSGRLHQWKNFLNEYEFIGMSKSSMKRNLGPAKWNDRSAVLVDFLPDPDVSLGKLAKYFLYCSSACGRGQHILEVLFDESDRVSAWRVNSMGIENHWFKTNMVFPAGEYFQFDKENFGLIERGSLQAISFEKDNFWVSAYKKKPSALMKSKFFPQPVLCGNSVISQFEGIGDAQGVPYELKVEILATSPSKSQSWQDWKGKLEVFVNEKFRSCPERSMVEDRLLVVNADFRVRKDGRVLDLAVDTHCPADFLSMIVHTLQDVEGSALLIFPDDSFDDVTLHTRFMQNYGPKFLSKPSAD